jgi:hypothetical protein
MLFATFGSVLQLTHSTPSSQEPIQGIQRTSAISLEGFPHLKLCGTVGNIATVCISQFTMPTPHCKRHKFNTRVSQAGEFIYMNFMGALRSTCQIFPAESYQLHQGMSSTQPVTSLVKRMRSETSAASWYFVCVCVFLVTFGLHCCE